MLKWVVTLLVSVIGALVAEEYSGTIKDIPGVFRDALVRIRAVLIGAIIGMTFLGGFLFAEELPWSLILDIAPLFGAGVVTTWAAYMLWRIDRTNRMQVRLLRWIARDRRRPDGGLVDGDADDDPISGDFDVDERTAATTGSGAIAGATMGGAIGSLFGPQGAFAGAIIGASLGDSLEADANEGGQGSSE